MALLQAQGATAAEGGTRELSRSTCTAQRRLLDIGGAASGTMEGGEGAQLQVSHAGEAQHAAARHHMGTTPSMQHGHRATQRRAHPPQLCRVQSPAVHGPPRLPLSGSSQTRCAHSPAAKQANKQLAEAAPALQCSWRRRRRRSGSSSGGTAVRRPKCLLRHQPHPLYLPAGPAGPPCTACRRNASWVTGGLATLQNSRAPTWRPPLQPRGARRPRWPGLCCRCCWPWHRACGAACGVRVARARRQCCVAGARGLGLVCCNCFCFSALACRASASRPFAGGWRRLAPAHPAVLPLTSLPPSSERRSMSTSVARHSRRRARRIPPCSPPASCLASAAPRRRACWRLQTPPPASCCCR